MSDVFVAHVRSALEELSDIEYQRRVWAGLGAPEEMSSFDECVEQLFSDSGLGDALERHETGFGVVTNGELIALRASLARIDGARDPGTLVGQPAMRRVRERAAYILRLIEEGVESC